MIGMNEWLAPALLALIVLLLVWLIVRRPQPVQDPQLTSQIEVAATAARQDLERLLRASNSWDKAGR